jgi:hypothetical protein
MRGLLTVSSHDDEWYVSVGDGATYLVGFAGPAAQEMALQQHRELSALLDVTDAGGTERIRRKKARRFDR